MNHQPTQLALLISLIGVGVAPGAFASSNPSARPDDRAIDTMQPLPGMPRGECEAGTLPTCGADSDLVWQPSSRGPLDRTATAGVRVLYNTARDDWAPGEVAGQMSDEFARLGHWLPRQTVRSDAKPPEVRDATLQTSPRKSAGKPRKVRVLAQAPAPARVKAQGLAREDGAALQRIAPIQVVPVRTDAGSLWGERQLDGTLAALLEAPVMPATGMPPAPPAAQTGAAQAIVARIPDTEPAQPARVQAAVDTQSNTVLRNLGAILSEDRDEVGAIRAVAPQAVVTTQTGKVMAMLGEIAAAQPVVEDGPAKRLRKLAARAAKAEAKAAADAATAEAARPASEAAAQLAAEIARDGVDLMLPLEPASAAPALPSGEKVARTLVEPSALPLDAKSTPATARAPRDNPFGGRQVAVAESALDRVRGGFAVDGLNISFGIERAVYVNGALVTTTSLNISDLGRVTAGRGTTSFNVGSMGLIQSGANNVVSTGAFSSTTAGTVIQNTLDGQKIQNVTVINATANSLNVFRGLNLGSSLRSAVIESLRR